MARALQLILWASLALPAPVVAQSEPTTILTVGDEPKQMMRYGLDYERLWFWYGPAVDNSAEVAQWSVVDCKIDYIRCAINSAYELTEGQYNLSAYTQKIIPMMRAMQEADPDIKWFASPRPLNEAIRGAAWQPYPRWVTGDDGSGNFDFNWEKCAEYLIRYLVLMDSYGFKISYLDVTNEWQSYPTGKRLQPSDVVDIRQYLLANLPKGIEMPKIVAPSAWSFQQGANFINHAVSRGEEDGFDIAASHNTGYQGTAEAFAEAATAAGKEIWDSEVHGWKGSSPATEIPTSSQMFERIRAGFSGLNGWLTIGTTNQGHCYLLNNGSSVIRNVKYYIFRKLTNTSNYGRALDINQPSAFTSTAALIRGNLLTVWILNNASEAVLTRIDLGDRTNGNDTVAFTRWSESLPVEGLRSATTAPATDSFTTTIAANSLYCFEVTLQGAEDDFPLVQAENYSAISGAILTPIADDGSMIEFCGVGDEITFDLTIIESATFDVAFRVSSASSPISFDLYEGESHVGSVERIATGDAQNWTTLHHTLRLAGGPTTLTLRAAGGGWNLDWIQFKEQFSYFLVNLAVGQVANASGSSGRLYTASKAVDERVVSRWESSGTQPTWLEVEFESPTTINGFALDEYEDRITGYEIQSKRSDETWETVFSGDVPVRDEILFFPAATAASFRFLLQSATTETVSLNELKFYYDAHRAYEDPIPSATVGNNGLTLSWSGELGASYRVERSFVLDPMTFETLESGIPFDASENHCTVSVPAEDSLYRVVLERD